MSTSIMFNTLLRGLRISPADVTLLRHKDKRADKGRGPYELWRDNTPAFEDYQSTQRIGRRKLFSAPYWAAFLVNSNRETMFGGLYQVRYIGLLPHDRSKPHIQGEIDKAGTCDLYQATLDNAMSDLIGKLFIDWGQSAINWAQYAKRNNKHVTELRLAFREDIFPGFLSFVEPLSRIEKLPTSWQVTLSSSRGVYLLTCPKTKALYVGSATGASGFWGRWLCYAQTNHGGNVELMKCDPSDYQVSVLEVAGTSATVEAILAMEWQWKLKLRGKLNKN